MRKPIARILWPLAVMVSLGGCGPNEGQTFVTTPQGAADIIATNQVAKAVLFAAADPFEPGTSDPAPAVAAAVDRYYEPRACVSLRTGLNTITYNFSACSGPLGIVRVKGEVVVTYAPAGNATVIRVNSSALFANDATVNINLQATYDHQEVLLRRLTIADNTTGRGGYNNTVSQVGNGIMTWHAGEVCAGYDANGTMIIGNRHMDQVFDSNQFCPNRCPTGRVLLTNVQNSTFEVRLDGTNTALWHDTTGATGTVAIVCGP
jgi:hypothetical protein